jgi:hypothetical protein
MRGRLESGGELLCEVTEVGYRHGRHSISYEPDLCGRPSVVLADKRPDQVVFTAPVVMQPGACFRLRLEHGPPLDITVREVAGSRVAARVDEPAP